ncbi:OLC1v1028060C2 [Oldenlandia corymbosa var. corymbosa]|uniref:OLC1v1028060C2 n=1 Tax=Oldenlandia corymbosa var. corymbosa TaxID=529605 RepID=A0AAV1CAU6_OLDCO|nr:OLC1v1028060C2 [Oldenlandia corymbosa var. corymbosa]
MEMESQKSDSWEGYVNWRGKPAVKGRHGGMKATSFVLVVEVLENLAFLANASNLVRYFAGYMHFSPSESANSVTNYMGTAFLLALLGGFLSDAFCTTYVIYLISAVVEFLGLVILTIQARTSSLQPPKCDPANPNSPCEQVHGAQAAMLFIGLYLVALGVGGIKGSLPAHGAEQLDQESPKGRKQRSTFFNYYVFCLSCGALIAVTLVVWVEDNKGWQWGFGISTLAILLSIPVFLLGSTFYRNKIPSGSPITTIAKVLLAAFLNCGKSKNSSNAIVNMGTSPSPTPVSEEDTGPALKSTITVAEQPSIQQETPSASLSFLNRAVGNTPGSFNCSVQQVEEVKIVFKILPIFACTIILNCCLAQLSTFSVQQAATMDTKVGSLKVPPASLPIFPVVFMMILAPVYDHVIVPFARRATKTEMGISHLQRIGTGLVLSIVAMAVAALVEIKRKRVATEKGLLDSAEPLPIRFFWIAFQYLFLGSADLFTLAGLLEFFFTEAPTSMRSLATSLSWASLAMGYYLSTVMVSIVNSATGNSGHPGWLSGRNLNHYHLERFYWLMCVLSVLNLLHYLFWAMRYKYRSVRSINTTTQEHSQYANAKSVLQN